DRVPFDGERDAGRGGAGGGHQASYLSRTRRSSVRTPQPVAPLANTAPSLPVRATPAMSMWHQGVPSMTKRPRNCAAVIAPPQRPAPTFLMSATSDLSSRSYSSPRGIGHAPSPSALAAL